MMTESLIEAVELGKTYHQGLAAIKALVSATCTVAAGDRIALMGPSGSGKSTLLHLMAGFEEPTSGSISWPALGSQHTLLPEQVGFVFQTQSLLAPLTVLENVELPLLIAGAPKEAARSAAFEIIKSMELEILSEKLPEELSGGQAQRVAVARAMVTKPKLILADEPTGQLDHPTAEHLFDVLLASLEGSDTALVISTHDVTVSKRMKQVWQIKRGILEV